MKLFEIKIDDKSYDLIDTIKLDNKNYVAYKDSDNNIYISEFINKNNSISFLEIDEETINKVRMAMQI